MTTDDDGYLVPDVAASLIPPHWQELIEAILAFIG
ncbi:MAG: hypothetical protein JWM96_108, partial [Alphaproteobacteria bacterium]|nr:hypothetical protein [Alphaproteobacteria bacterium]